MQPATKTATEPAISHPYLRVAFASAVLGNAKSSPDEVAHALRATLFAAGEPDDDRFWHYRTATIVDKLLPEFEQQWQARAARAANKKTHVA